MATGRFRPKLSLSLPGLIGKYLGQVHVILIFTLYIFLSTRLLAYEFRVIHLKKIT